MRDCDEKDGKLNKHAPLCNSMLRHILQVRIILICIGVIYDSFGSVNTYRLESLTQLNFKVTVYDYKRYFNLFLVEINQIITILKNLKKSKMYFYVRIYKCMHLFSKT